MTSTLSRVMSGATAAYAVFALVKPDHLGRAMEASPAAQPTYDRLARAYGVRDLVIGALGVAGTPRAVRVAMGLRVASDLVDAAYLSNRADTSTVRTKVLGATLGWATLNTAALALDRRR